MVRVIQSKVECDGMVFDSKEEFGFYVHLLGDPEVSCIRRQTQFQLIPKQEQMVVKHLKTKDKLVSRLLERPVQYHADFVYRKNGTIIICDVKSKYTASFREFSIIRKLMVQKIAKHNKKRHGGEPMVSTLSITINRFQHGNNDIFFLRHCHGICGWRNFQLINRQIHRR